MKHTFNIDHGTIRLVVSHNGIKYRRSTGISISPALWESSAKKMTSKCKDSKAWEKLRPIHLRLQEREDSVKTEADVMRAIDYAIYGEKRKAPSPSSSSSRPTFWEYFRAWGERPSPVQRQRRLYPNVVSKLMGENEDWEDIDSAYYFRLCRAMDDYGCSINYKGAIISKLKVVMNEGYKQKFHKNEEFRQFRRMGEVPETIALDAGEVDKLFTFPGFTHMERKAADLFIIGVYSVARWEDYSRLSLDNISDGMLNYEQLKTGKSVILPASPRLVSCLERNGGRAPVLSQQKFNDAIKRCCKKIGMTQKIHISRSVGAGRVSEHLERWKCVSSHTARRTGCSLLYFAGVPIKRIMMCSGHSTEATFFRYIRISKEENAKMLKGLDFFK